VVASQTLTQMDPSEDVTSLKLIGFSIEVETDPVTLLMQTDRALSVLRYPRPSCQILFMPSVAGDAYCGTSKHGISPSGFYSRTAPANSRSLVERNCSADHHIINT
jgi:hypothetical protein